jgi:hypothetical protein
VKALLTIPPSKVDSKADSDTYIILVSAEWCCKRVRLTDWNQSSRQGEFRADRHNTAQDHAQTGCKEEIAISLRPTGHARLTLCVAGDL